MTEHKPILVTGATGTVGREVVSQLLAAGMSVRALVRDPATAGLPVEVQVLRGDLSDPGTVAAAVDGVAAVFLVWPFISAAAAADLAPTVVDVIAEHAGRIVYLSSEGAGHDPDSFWAALERLVAGSGAEWTLLRPSGFAKNTLIWADQIRAEGVVRWPYGASARSLIHERDIAAVAVRALIEDGHTHTTYVLTGPEALTQVEQVRTIGEAIGRPLRWEEISREHVRPALITAFGDEAFADAALDAWAAFQTRPERVTATVQEITGTPARSLLDWAHEHAEDFR
jgi:uncharacterized protein YbjT (DUF2867 family)